MTTDITQVIAASRAHIVTWHATATELADQSSGPRPGQGQAAAWGNLVRLMTLHMAAVEEICLPAIWAAAPDGQALARAVVCEQEDIRELIREARLQPPGSPQWQQLAAAAQAAWAARDSHAGQALLDALRYVGPARRQQLARQWHAFADACERDRMSTSPAWT